MRGFSWPHLLLILAVVLLLFGATKLPDLAKNLGQSLKIFRNEIKSDGDAKPGDSADDGPAATPQSAATSGVGSATAPGSEDTSPGRSRPRSSPPAAPQSAAASASPTPSSTPASAPGPDTDPAAYRITVTPLPTSGTSTSGEVTTDAPNPGKSGHPAGQPDAEPGEATPSSAS